ncbi:hypothetical protein GMST_31560 [Geomonas silvestris]|uniref:Uncharacterized protein n=1 Tax=Geomonas silvestris TaxID=2740184 RepID=A0A6V8MLB3_9BACT|nr:hypothetical protein [Geomonas silvestris]GFO60831.1 hypothetical protein GMST_31560 [Geomonas silvestris]
MLSLKKLEAEVASLPDKELRQFSQWFAQYEAERWDRALKTDVAAGKLDHLADEALAQFAAGKCKPL